MRNAIVTAQFSKKKDNGGKTEKTTLFQAPPLFFYLAANVFYVLCGILFHRHAFSGNVRVICRLHYLIDICAVLK